MPKAPLILLVLVALLLTGCPNPNIYGTPRTTPKGEIAQTVALEVYAAEVPSQLDEDEDATWLIPTAPSYTLRWGLADRVDLGFRSSSLALIGMDAKVNFLRGDLLDLAVDPGGQVLLPAVTNIDGPVAYAHLPLLAGLNFSDSTTLLLTAGYLGWYAPEGDPAQELSHYARFGAGLEVRASDSFALQPEVTAITSGSGKPLILVGWGLTFGALPSRDNQSDTM